MKCLNCGCTNEHYLCDTCTRADVLEKVFNEIRFYKPETCENLYLSEFASGLIEKCVKRDIILDISELFDLAVLEFYYCQHYRIRIQKGVLKIDHASCAAAENKRRINIVLKEEKICFGFIM